MTDPTGTETLPKPERKKRVRRSALEIELSAFADVMAALKPLSTEQRHRVFKSAMELLPQDKEES